MLFHRSINRLARAAGLAIMVLALSAATAAAHTQTVTPNGNGEGFTKPISNPLGAGSLQRRLSGHRC